MNDAIGKIKSAFDWQQQGKSIVIRCPRPEHEDRNPSCTITPEGQGYQVVCSCGENKEAWRLIKELARISNEDLGKEPIGLRVLKGEAVHEILETIPDSFGVPPKLSSSWAPNGTTYLGQEIYEYTDWFGARLGYMCRLNYQEGTARKKKPMQLAAAVGTDGKRGWAWKQNPYVKAFPFGAMDLWDNGQHPPETRLPVLVVEGEKAAKAARKLFHDRVVIGVNSAFQPSPETRQMLEFIATWQPGEPPVVEMWADNDKTGLDHFRYGGAMSMLFADSGWNVRVVPIWDIQDLPPKWDLADVGDGRFGSLDADLARVWLERAVPLSSLSTNVIIQHCEVVKLSGFLEGTPEFDELSSTSCSTIQAERGFPGPGHFYGTNNLCVGCRLGCIPVIKRPRDIEHLPSTWLSLLTRYAWDRTSNQFIDIFSGDKIGKDAFNTDLLSTVKALLGNTQNTLSRPVQVMAEQAKEHRLEANGVRFLPGMPPVFDMQGERFANAFNQKPFSVAQTVSPRVKNAWEDSLKAICGEDDGHGSARSIMRWYFAHLFLRPSVRFQWMLFWMGEQGIGKNLRLEILRAVFGPRMVFTVGKTMLSDNTRFTPWLESPVVNFDEITMTTSVWQWLKVQVFSEMVTFENKSEQAATVPNISSFIFTTNEGSHKGLDLLERRLLIINSLGDEKLMMRDGESPLKPYNDVLIEMIHDKQMQEELMRHLMESVDLGDYSAKGDAPRVERGTGAAVAAPVVAGEFLTAAFARFDEEAARNWRGKRDSAGQHPLLRGVCRLPDIYSWYEKLMDKPVNNAQTQMISTELKRARFFVSRPGSTKWDGKRESNSRMVMITEKTAMTMGWVGYGLELGKLADEIVMGQAKRAARGKEISASQVANYAHLGEHGAAYRSAVGKLFSHHFGDGEGGFSNWRPNDDELPF